MHNSEGAFAHQKVPGVDGQLSVCNDGNHLFADHMSIVGMGVTGVDMVWPSPAKVSHYKHG